MIKYLLSWWWKPRIEKAAEFLYKRIPSAYLGSQKHETIDFGIREPSEAEEVRDPWREVFISYGGKPVCTFRLVGGHGFSEWLEYKRFNYGSWCKPFYEFYLGERRRKDAEDKIIRDALFSPLDE